MNNPICNCIFFPWRLLLLGFALAILPNLLAAQKATPEPTEFLINDYAGLLGRSEVIALGRKLRDYVGETSTQIVVVTERSLEGDDPFAYAQRLASSWGIGGGANDNGILIFVAQQERQVRIQTGRGAEGLLPDVNSKRVIENIIDNADHIIFMTTYKIFYQ